MPPPDPLAPIVQALSFIAVPNPALQNPPQAPATWTSGTATQAAFFTPAQMLLGLILGASSDLTSLGNSINSALTGIAAALASFAGDIGDLTTLASNADAAQVLTGLQTVLSLAQGFAPVAAAGTLQSASAFFGQIDTLLNDLALTTAELAEISQQLTAAAPLFPAS